MAPFDEFPRISLENEGNSSSDAETRNSALLHSSSGSEKKQPSGEILQNAREMTDGIS